VSFAGAAIADKDDRFGFGDVIALGQFMNLLSRNLEIARGVEFLQGLHAR